MRVSRIRRRTLGPAALALAGLLIAACGSGGSGGLSTGIEAINGAVILFALVLARIVGGESTAEER